MHAYELRKNLDRLIPRLDDTLSAATASEKQQFLDRLERLFPTIFEILLQVYGDRYDFFYHLEHILNTAAEYYVRRSPTLKTVDAEREANPLWFQSQKLVGGQLYIDLFAGDLAGLKERIPYFNELGVNYLHLMPLYKTPKTNSDGGYAVSSFREVNPKLGSMPELIDLAQEFRKNGINLCLDFIFNHTSDEHTWAQKALAGDVDFQNYYFMFPDRTEPDEYEQMLREIFPEFAPGCFSYRPEVDKWVWTTFFPFQWDLNYRNPEVFDAVLGEMLFLANVGVDVLRLDAVPFIWKEKGTPCENLPPSHWLIQAYNALVRLVSPGMVFKSEAIVHPDDVASYFGRGERAGYECPISYNPTLMALLWEALATRDVKLLHYSMQKRFAHPDNCAWVNYLRVHDDIGWSFADEDAHALNMNGFHHRQFLNQFYTGEFAGSFAEGLRFNFNPETLDARICGTLASLAGLEHGLKTQEIIEINHSVQRILMLYGVIMSIGGIPLIYMGDELATLNDYSYQGDPNKSLDERWVHRVALDPDRLARRESKDNVEGRVYQGIRQMIDIRKGNRVFAGGDTRIVESGNPHVFAFTRWQNGQGFLGLFNFAESDQMVDIARFRVFGLPQNLVDAITGRAFVLNGRYEMAPYQYAWLMTELD